MSRVGIPPAHKEWAKYLRSMQEESCSVTNYISDDGLQAIHIFASKSNQKTFAATVGLMDVDMQSPSGSVIHSEVLMDKRGPDASMGNVLSTIAFYVMRDGWRIAPGTVFESLVEMYIPGTGLPHVLFVSPWQSDSLSRVQILDRTIYPLVAAPISQEESLLARSNRGLDLESRWEKMSTDVLDWNRKSAV